MSYVYLVYGSEDGNLGVFGSKKRAVERAVSYCSPDDNPYDEDVEVDTGTSDWMVYCDGYGLDSSVERFEVE